MSADLFAAFSDSPSSSSQGQRQSSGNAPQPTTATSDPFAFLPSSNKPAQQQHQAFQQTSLWPSYQEQQQQEQPSLWPTFQQPPVTQQNANTDIWGGVSRFGGTQGTQAEVKPAQNGDGDDDGWGDFEVAAPENLAPMSAPAPAVALSISPAVANSPAVPVVKPEPSPRTRIMRASTLDLITNNLVDTRSMPKPLETWQERPSWEQSERSITSPAKVPNPDPNVLFDADDFDGVAPPDEEEEDDFGEFESVAAPVPAPALTAQPAPAKSALDLMSDLDFGPAPTKTRKEPPSQLLSTLSVEDSRYPQAPKSPSFQERNPFPGLGLTTPKSAEFPKEVKPKPPSPVTAWPEFDDQNKERSSFDDSWGEFNDLPVSSGPTAKANPQPKAQTSKSIKPSKPAKAAPAASSDWDWDAWEGTDNPKPARSTATGTALPDRDVSGPPPTNVPPPSILLSAFPELLGLANSSLFKPLSSQPASVKDRVMANPTTTTFLRGYLALATVAARIIAGRKLRWHRDKFLSQSMTISAAGGKGGMKLSGIDKTQARSEDREAADVVAAWKEYVGRLRSAVVAANSNATAAGEPQLKVPELAETTVVQTAKGVATAPKPCVVCGLKREERVPRVDFDVEDSFGEWWVEHWGHRTCRNFWLEHEVRLRQR